METNEDPVSVYVAKVPACPHCGGGQVRELHHSPPIYRYECGKLECMKAFEVVRGHAEPPPPEEARLVAFEKGVVVGKPSCGKCGKTFRFNAWRARHEKTCGGGKPKRPLNRAPRNASRRALDIHVAEQPAGVPVAPTGRSRPSILAEVMLLLDEREAELRKELVELSAFRERLGEKLRP
jgi:ribosomal protein S27AE